MCFITFSCLWKQDNHWHHSGDKGERWADWDERQEVEWKERREVEKEVRETKRRKGWEARDRKQLTFMFLVNRKCHFELASLHPLLLHLTQGSPTTLASIPITQMWPPLFRHYFPASPFFYFYRSTAWPVVFIQAFLHLPVVISISQTITYATSGQLFSSPLWFFSLRF